MKQQKNPFQESDDRRVDEMLRDMEETPDSQPAAETCRPNGSREGDSDVSARKTRPAGPEPTKKKKGKKGKTAGIIAIILVVAILLTGIFFVLGKLNLIGSVGDDEWFGSNDIDASQIDSITDADSLNALLKSWATNGGDKMNSKYVKNILLLGVDSDSKLSDSMILMSINERTKQINMVSFYRDSYTYIRNNTFGGFFAKMNAAYGYGGAKCVVRTIEDDYKIKIDDYALVDYDSFPKVIDALGGVDVNVTKAEADYLNRTWKKWSRTGKKIQFKEGKMHMDGEHALMFCRIRKLDSDVERTERQRRVITALMDRFKTASLKQMNSAINTLLPYIKTSMSKGQIVGYAKDAIVKNWSDYKIVQFSMPTEKTSLAGYAGDQWIWICDYEGAAYILQKKLYGQTNITLDPNRTSALTFAKAHAEKQTQPNPQNTRPGATMPYQLVQSSATEAAESAEEYVPNVAPNGGNAGAYTPTTNSYAEPAHTTAARTAVNHVLPNPFGGNSSY